MPITIHRDFSECDVLWFSANEAFDPGSFVEGHVPAASTGKWVASGRWLYSGKGQNDVVSCSWQKVVEGDDTTGVCMMMLKSNKGWEDLIQPGDALLVFMTSYAGTNKKKTVLESIVFVDSVGAPEAVANGAEVKTVMVSARDATKIFAESSTVFDAAFVITDQLFYKPAFLERQGGKFGLSPLEMVMNIVNIFYNALTDSISTNISEMVRLQWRFPGAEQIPIVSLIDFSTFVQAPLYGYCAPAPIDMTEAGNLLTLIRSFANDCINEIFFDVRDLTPDAKASIAYQEEINSPFVFPDDVIEQKRVRQKVASDIAALGTGFVSSESDQDIVSSAGVVVTSNGERSNAATLAMVFRQRPYDTNSFMKLPFSVIDETEISQFSPTRSYQNVHNFFRVDSAPTLPRLIQEATFGIKVNPKSISRFGLRRRDLQTRYPFATRQESKDWNIGKNTKPDFDSTFFYYIDLVSAWEAFNERYVEGSMAAIFRPDVRVGTRLQVNYRRRGKAKTLHFYVQGVRHNFFETPGASQSIFTLVRGINMDDVTAPETGVEWTSKGSSYREGTSPYEVFRTDGFKADTKDATDLADGLRAL